MPQHIRANLWLLVLTLLLCSLIYPLILLGVGQAVFHDQAQGSLVYEGKKPIGSRLIAQPFTDKDGNALAEYFQPRPSAVAYRADASGASNWAASNYKLRERVARALGPIVKYGPNHPKKGQLVGPDIETWFQKDRYQGKPGIVAQWAKEHPDSAKAWVQGDANKLNAEYVVAWWTRHHSHSPAPAAEEVVGDFLASFSAEHSGTWPATVEHPTADGKIEKRIEPVKEGSDIQSVFFDTWRQDHPDEDLEPVPADLVMASGSGLDPHITRKNATYQLPGVAAAWAKKAGGDAHKIRSDIEALIQEKTEAPLGGLIGVDLVNVFELNRALQSYAERHWMKPGTK